MEKIKDNSAMEIEITMEQVEENLKYLEHIFANEYNNAIDEDKPLLMALFDNYGEKIQEKRIELSLMRERWQTIVKHINGEEVSEIIERNYNISKSID